MIRRLALCLLLLALLVAACQSDSPTPTATPEPTATLPTEGDNAPRPPTHTPGPTPTPTMPPVLTPDYNSSTPQPIDNHVMPGEWRIGHFDEPSGVRHRLVDFERRGLVLHLLTANCTHCLEQHQILVQAAGTLLDADLLSDTAVVALGINPLEPASFLESTLRSALGEDAAIATRIAGDADADWIVGSASRDLLSDLESAFGEDMLDAEFNVIIVIEPNGLAHVISNTYPIPERDLLSAIPFYGNAPTR